jgi:hypothetical protein
MGIAASAHTAVPAQTPVPAVSAGAARHGSSRKRWPATPLDAAQRAFELLVCPPAPLAFDGRTVAGLPDRVLPLDALKALLIDEETPRSVRDAVWRELVVRSRRDGPAWVVAAVGIALPGLRRAAGLLACGWHGDTRDRDSELLVGFVERLRTLDVRQRRIVGKLIDAGVRAAKKARECPDDLDVIRVQATWSRPPQQPWGHPDWVLDRAVAAAIISSEESALIGSTRLEDIRLAEMADALGISVSVAAAWRRKAERRLAAAIRAGELDRAPMRRTTRARAAAS